MVFSAEFYIMHSEEDNVFSDDKKRRLKTPSQVAALEKFYNEHNYPSELMKSEFALKIGLSVKQISRWFCHRRLKDKNRLKDDACVSGKQDLSNSFLQGQGSGLRQDSCGNTKQGDYRHFDPREVESQRFHGQDYPVAVHASENRDQHMHTREYGSVHNASSGGSSGPQDKRLTLRYSSQDSNSMLVNTEGVKGREYMMASEYLYLQDEIENPAISAVKKQLGRFYRPDGPPIGVEFQPLPPGAFDSSLGDPIHELYYVGNPGLQNSHSIPRVVSKESNVGMAYDIYRYKSHPHDSYPEEPGSRITMRESDHQKGLTRYSSAHRSFTSYDYRGSVQNSAMDVDGDSVGETSEFSSSYSTLFKHRVEWSSISNKESLHLYDRKVKPNESYYSRLQSNSISSHGFKKREYFESGSTNSVLRSCESFDAEEKFQPRRMTKFEQLFKEKNVYEHNNSSNPLRTKSLLRNKMKMGKRLKGDEFQGLGSTTSQELPRTKAIRGSAGEMPTSFSEDETASSNSSLRTESS